MLRIQRTHFFHVSLTIFSHGVNRLLALFRRAPRQTAALDDARKAWRRPLLLSSSCVCGLRMREMDNVESVGGESANRDARAMKSIPGRRLIRLSVAVAMIDVPALGAIALP
jgi:hypothetical protein